MQNILKTSLILCLSTWLLSGCFHSHNIFKHQGVIEGQASYLELVDLPPEAIFEAVLEDVSLADMTAPVISQIYIDPAGQIPISFKIHYNKELISASHRYNIRAAIKANDKLIFITDTAYPVLTGKADKALTLLMKPVDIRNLKTTSMSDSVVDIQPFNDYPAHFLGLLPCADCQSIQYQIDFLSSQAYFLETVYFDHHGSHGSSFYEIGRWHYYPNQKQLKLERKHQAPLLFSVVDVENIELLDASGMAIESDLNYRLEASYTARLIEPALVMQGMLHSSENNEILFRECLTGLILPVSREKDVAELQSAYQLRKEQTGEQIKVEVNGVLAANSITPTNHQPVQLIVKQFIKSMPKETCAKPYINTSLTDTYWRLTALNDQALEKRSTTRREAHLIFSKPASEKATFSGSTGCNRINGHYKRDQNQLSIDTDQMAMTRMACPPGNIEQEFIKALHNVKSWEINANHLQLIGPNQQSIARFVADKQT